MAKTRTNWWQDAKGNSTIAQAPNRWAVMALVGWLIARTFQDSGLIDFIGYAIFYLAAAYWAYLEITDGDSQFRQLLGGFVAVLLTWSLINQFV